MRATFGCSTSPRTKEAALAARLARGVFAKPGVYPATVRFANAASTIKPDSSPDVRALSFAVSVPGGVFGADPLRLDFSMNSTPTFAINDAHAFAALMRVLGALGALGHLRALLSLSFTDLKGFFKTAVRGFRQEHGALQPYQRTRYWSNVPFLHGGDEAIKYAATPAPDNPGGAIGKGASVLRDDLLQFVNGDAPQASFDFALQLLEPTRMTQNGRTREPSFWVENASVEWPEGQAPFYTVGRLTLQAKSELPPLECEGWSIDVTEHAFPGHRPIGSINRARWVAEAASRKARLSAAAVPAAGKRSLGSRLAAIRLGSIVKAVTIALGVLAVAAAAAAAVLIVRTNRGDGMLPPETVDRVVYPDQGWGAGVEAAPRQTYYYTAQGAQLKELRYSWFRNLEMPWSRTKISSPEIMRRYGFLVDGVSRANPDGLPVGFSKAFDAERGDARHHVRRVPHRPKIAAPRRSGSTAGRRCIRSPTPGSATSCPRSRRPARHAGQSDQVRPLRRRRAGSRSPRRTLALRAQMLDVAGQFGAVVESTASCRPRRATAAPMRSRGLPTPCSAITSRRATTPSATRR